MRSFIFGRFYCKWPWHRPVSQLHVVYVAQYRCLRNKRPSKPYDFIGFGAMDVTKPYEFIWFGDIPGSKPYGFIGFRWAFISQTPVMLPDRRSAFRAGLRPDSNREALNIRSPAGLRPAGGPFLILGVLRAKIKIKNPRIRAGIGPTPTTSLGKWQSGPSPGTPRGRGGQEINQT